LGLQFKGFNRVSKPILVYTEKGHGKEKDWVNHLVYPIRAYWGDGTSEWPKWEKDFQFYKTYFELTDDPNEGDVGFLPMTLNYYINNNQMQLVDSFVNKMDKLCKKVVIWVDGDNDVNYSKSNCILIKYSGYKSNNKINEFIMPGDLKIDLLDKYFSGKVVIREKLLIPSVGFIGIAEYPKIKLILLIFKNMLLQFIYFIKKSIFEPSLIIPYLIKRKKILKKIMNDARINSNVMIRNRFAFGIRDNNRKARMEFINNIVNNDYSICMRGAGNYSIRFYETLCLGRIPIFVNTDCVLPFEDKINWKDHCIWIEESNKKNIGNKILEFHQNISNTDFMELQQKNRIIWEKYFSIQGFNRQLYIYINNIVI